MASWPRVLQLGELEWSFDGLQNGAMTCTAAMVANKESHLWFRDFKGGDEHKIQPVRFRSYILQNSRLTTTSHSYCYGHSAVAR